MKGLRWLMALALGFGLVIWFAGCEGDDTITKIDRCSNAMVKYIKNCEEGGVTLSGQQSPMDECLWLPDATVSCVLNASGEDNWETCLEMEKCYSLAYTCADIVYYCEGFIEEGMSEYEALERCVVEIDQKTLACIWQHNYFGWCGAVWYCVEGFGPR